ncbi:MAG: oligosaccharide flippase family protein, partial [Bacteroidetes bacterium]|nr:oligosaccharide flippase family protein [Bacteroidota bacterium]
MSNNYEAIQQGSTVSRLKFLLKDSVLYGGAGAISKMVAVFLIPILARAFTKEDYGVVDAITVIGTLLMHLAVTGLDSATARFYYEKEDTVFKKQIMTNALLFQLFFSLVISGLVILFSNEILRYYLHTTNYNYELKIMALSLPFTIIVKFTINLLKWTFQRTLFLFISLGTPVFIVSLTILFVKIYGAEIKNVFYAQLIGQFIFSIFSCIIIRHHLIAKPKLEYLKPLLHYGLPLMLTTVIISVIPTIDRYFVNNYFGMEQLGIYAIAVKIAAFSSLAIFGFQTAWGPMSFSIHKEKNAYQTYNVVLKIYVILLVFFSFVFTLFLNQIVVLMASAKYIDAIPLVMPIIFSL